MAKDQRAAEELSIEELEAILARKKLAAREERLRRFRRSGRALQPAITNPPTANDRTEASDEIAVQPESDDPDSAPESRFPAVLRRVFNRLLLWVEIAAVVGLAVVFFNSFGILQELNQETAEVLAGSTATPLPLITAVVLPSGHVPPTDPGGARPNEDEIPEHLRPLVQSLPMAPVPTQGPEQASNIFIPELWEQPAPVVQGDGWEQLKKGVAQHIGTANPGEKGNLVLSAHNDIFGELFRYLDRLKPGDSIQVITASNQFEYRITGTRVVEPTEVSVMDSTPNATITLISCYPYLVDNQRIIVFGELVEQ
jgi:sortase A